ncbi:hypothetical protein [Amycolatopsis sp. CA-128772]|uniref:hypothetical protein n=1 Tax=Amycolatopsis sp. CA-128772 TaxID=2073159 RepID=UPI0011B00EDA|nr:hypothetical protein [Amycolatopsis sp. CA-128772]
MIKGKRKLTKSRFHVAIALGNSSKGLADLTKRAVLVSDTLLLSHDWAGKFHPLDGSFDETDFAAGGMEGAFAGSALRRIRDGRELCGGFRCPDLDATGRWILDAEPLLRSGLAWYLPSYSKATYPTHYGERYGSPSGIKRDLGSYDFLIRNGRAVDCSGVEPIKSRVVRPVLHTELPFLEGVDLSNFGKITVGEFDAYAAFRDFLRLRLLELDDAIDDTQSERALVKIGLEINEGIRSIGIDLGKATRKRAVASTGAVLGTVGAVLVAVYGPALAGAVAALGASGGIWGVVNAATEYNKRAFRHNKWYYVWMLTKSRRSDYL